MAEREVSSDIQNVVNSMEFLAPLSSRDARTRKQALDTVCSFVDQYLDGYDSTSIAGNDAGLLERASFLQSILPGILRVSVACPFSDVREKLSNIFEEIKVRKLYIITVEMFNFANVRKGGCVFDCQPYKAYQAVIKDIMQEPIGTYVQTGAKKGGGGEEERILQIS